MKKMNHIVSWMLFIAMVLMSASVAGASPVEFLAVDMDGDGEVSVDMQNLDLFGSGFYLEYYDPEESEWVTYTEPFVVETTDNLGRVTLQLTDGDEALTDGEMIFLGSAGNLEGLDLYNLLMVDWGNINFSAIMGEDGDLLAAVPIPASALLLASGVIGLIGFRRRSERRALTR